MTTTAPPSSSSSSSAATAAPRTVPATSNSTSSNSENSTILPKSILKKPPATAESIVKNSKTRRVDGSNDCFQSSGTASIPRPTLTKSSSPYAASSTIKARIARQILAAAAAQPQASRQAAATLQEQQQRCRPRAFTRKTLRRKAAAAAEGQAATTVAQGNTLPTKGSSVSSSSSSNIHRRSNSSQNNNNNKNVNADVEDFVDASPPWHTAALISLLTSLLLRHCVPAVTASLDQELLAHPGEAFLMVQFPHIFSILDVATIRLLLGCVLLGHSLYVFLFANCHQETLYFPGSRLKSAAFPGIHFRGVLASSSSSSSASSSAGLVRSVTSGLLTVGRLPTLLIFLQGLAFFLAGIITWRLVLTGSSRVEDAAAAAGAVQVWMMRSCIVLWEIAAPASLLVSAIVTYIVWPMALLDNQRKQKSQQQQARSSSSSSSSGNSRLVVVDKLDATAYFKTWTALLEHNFNVIASLIEVCLLGRLPIRFGHACLAPLFGLLYVLHSYAMVDAWTTNGGITNTMNNNNNKVVVKPIAQATNLAHHGRPVYTLAHGGSNPQFLYPFLDTTLGWMTTAALVGFLVALTTSYLAFAWLQHSMQHDDNIYIHAAVLVTVGSTLCRFGD